MTQTGRFPHGKRPVFLLFYCQMQHAARRYGKRNSFVRDLHISKLFHLNSFRLLKSIHGMHLFLQHGRSVSAASSPLLSGSQTGEHSQAGPDLPYGHGHCRTSTTSVRIPFTFGIGESSPTYCSAFVLHTLRSSVLFCHYIIYTVPFFRGL